MTETYSWRAGVDDCAEFNKSGGGLSMYMEEARTELAQMADGRAFAIGMNELEYASELSGSVTSYEVYIEGYRWHHRDSWRNALDALCDEMVDRIKAGADNE